MFMPNRVERAIKQSKLSVEVIAHQVRSTGYPTTAKTIYNCMSNKSEPRVGLIAGLSIVLDKPVGYFFNLKHNRAS